MSQIGEINMPGGITNGSSVQPNSAGINGTGFILNERAKYTASTGMVTISTANTNLDGTGTLGEVIRAGALAKGTLIKSVTIKSSTNVGQGMVRLFVFDGTNTKLIIEVEIAPETIKSGIAHSFVKTIPLNFVLKAGWSLKASTELANTFNVIAEGLDWVYP
jgi:hypothetical protein